MAETTIEWTATRLPDGRVIPGYTFNPHIGCTKISGACAHCYAERDMDHRYKKAKWGPHGTRVITSPANWRKPIQWNKAARIAGVRPKVFCASLADVFEEWTGPISCWKEIVDPPCAENGFQEHRWRPVMWHRNDIGICEAGECTVDHSRGERHATLDDVRRQLFELIDATPHLDWLLLTKRPENILRMTAPCDWHACNTGDCPHDRQSDCDTEAARKYRQNVWLGTTVEDQANADRRIPELLKCRELSPVLFLSAEPLLGSVDLSHAVGERFCMACRAGLQWDECEPTDDEDLLACPKCGGETDSRYDDERIDWVITGGESGPHARPSHPAWFRSLRDQCSAAGVAYFHKQNGEFVDEMHPAAEGFPNNRFDQSFVKVERQYPGGEIVDYEGVFMARVGKAAAGRLLDGVEHNGMPSV